MAQQDFSDDPAYPKYYIIAVDGPVGAGKTTVCQKAAKKLGYAYLDTGAMYRCVALRVIEWKVDPDDSAAVANIARNIKITFSTGFPQVVTLDDADVTKEIRDSKVSDYASRIAVHASVRGALLKMQRNFPELVVGKGGGGDGGVIAEGRDMGSVVFPHAYLKVYMTAAPEMRAMRLYKAKRGGKYPDYAEILSEINKRDARDITREVAPLVQCPDAEFCDNNGMTITEQVTWLVKEIRHARDIMLQHRETWPVTGMMA